MVDFRKAPQFLIGTAARVNTPYLLKVPSPLRAIPMEQPARRSPFARHTALVVERL
jgi:hypothetical protein